MTERERTSWRHCFMCNRPIGFWRAVWSGMCSDCAWRRERGGGPLPWEDRGP